MILRNYPLLVFFILAIGLSFDTIITQSNNNLEESNFSTFNSKVPSHMHLSKTNQSLIVMNHSPG